VVYDRRNEGKILTYEPSGALLKGSLVMRDRETDSWWSIMTSRAIAGPLEGAPLRELPAATKTTWGEWLREHPRTLVLAVDGKTHIPENVYEDYFSSEEPYGDLEVSDERLAPRTPIFAFRVGERAVAVPHASIEGGKTFPLEASRDPKAPRILLFRPPGASVFASTRAYRFPSEMLFVPNLSIFDLMDRIEAALADPEEAERLGVERIAGMDTYWYSWVLQNPDTEVVR
jgi:hypothetical protein